MKYRIRKERNIGYDRGGFPEKFREYDRFYIESSSGNSPGVPWNWKTVEWQNSFAGDSSFLSEEDAIDYIKVLKFREDPKVSYIDVE